MSRLAAACLILLGSGCFFLDEPYKRRGGTIPADLGDGWEIATPQSVGLDPAALASIHDELLREDRHFGTLGFLVIKEGKLVFETWLRDDADRDALHHIQSVTKSVTSLAYGAALERGLVPQPDAELCPLLGDACEGIDAKKKDITLGHLLTMRSGIDFPNETFSLELWGHRSKNPLRDILSRPLRDLPGGRFSYQDADPQLVGYALQRQGGRTQESLVREWIFAPLGIQRIHWDRGPDGVSMGAHGLRLLPRDLAKIGQLVLDGGSWNGEQVISSAWIDRSLSPRSDTDLKDFAYGYYWWVVQGENAVAAWGHGGQFLLLVPEQRLLLVQVALPDASVHGSRLEDFLELTAPLRKG